jgi:hypothetical protein
MTSTRKTLAVFAGAIMLMMLAQISGTNPRGDLTGLGWALYAAGGALLLSVFV